MKRLFSFRWLIACLPLLFASISLAEPVRLSDLERQFQALQLAAVNAYTQGDYHASVAAYDEILDTVGIELFPEQAPGILYNLACSAALAGEPEKAIRALQAAVDAGWRNAEHLARDTDLDSIRSAPEFQEIAIRMERDAALEEKMWAGPALQTPYREDIPVAEKVAGLARIWMEAKFAFAFFDQVPELDWDAEYLASIPEVMATRSTREYYEILGRLVAKLRDGHTNITYPVELHEKVYAKPPVRTALIEGRVLVTGIVNPAVTSVEVGEEVVSIDETPVKEYAETRIRPYVCASTPQDSDNRTYDYELLTGDRDVPVTLGLRDRNGEERTVRIDRGLEWIHDAPLVESRILDGGIGYLAIHSFSSESPIDSLVETAMGELRSAHGLVIDIRDNGGGSSGWWVMEYLVAEYELTTWATRDYRPAFRAWGRQQTWYRSRPSSRPGFDPPKRFDGPVVLLTSPRTFSAAEDFAAVFRWSRRGKIVGEATAGSTGQPLFFRLPGGGSARICTKRDTYPDGSEFVGYGVQPDVEVHRTVEGYRSGRDEILEAALAVLR